MTNETELNQLNQYQVVSSFEGERKSGYRMEEGKKWRQFLAAVLCKWKSSKKVLKCESDGFRYVDPDWARFKVGWRVMRLETQTEFLFSSIIFDSFLNKILLNGEASRVCDTYKDLVLKSSP